jgi:3-deoxy-D-manno-octulosonic-acid transferase
MTERRRGVYLVYQLLLGVGTIVLAPWAFFRLLLQADFRRGLPGRLGFIKRLAPAPKRVLLHGVSVGEVKALRPLVRHIQTRLPDHAVVVSASTPSGLATARQAFPNLDVVPFPLDYAGAVRRFLSRVRPSTVVLAELEIWPNFLRACSRREISVAIVNGRITERSMVGYRKVQRLLPQFDRIAMYCVQNQRYADRFLALQVPPTSVVVTGNMKFDSLPQGGGQAGAPWTDWLQGQSSWVLASTHEPEESMLLRAAAEAGLLQSTRVLVVPRHPRRSLQLLESLRQAKLGVPIVLRSLAVDSEPLPEACVLLVDTFGELESIFAAVDLAFLGGSLIEHGGQNVLEAAAFGKPVLVGPHVDNFTEEVELLEASGGLRRGDDVQVLLEFARDWLQNPREAHKAGEAGRSALDARRGATETTFNALAQAGLF